MADSWQTAIMSNNLYYILGVAKNATAEEIKKAYQHLILSAHPDHGGSNAKFVEIKRAFEILVDGPKRKRYDLTGIIETKVSALIVSDELLQQCRARYRGSESETQAIRNAWMTHRGSMVQTLKDVPFMWADYTNPYDPESVRVQAVINGKKERKHLF